VYIWVEWKCLRCNTLHRTRFEIVVAAGSSFKLNTRDAWIHDEIRIQDIAIRKIRRTRRRYQGSKIYVEPYTPIQKIRNALTTYMMHYYSVQPDTLKMEVCKNG